MGGGTNTRTVQESNVPPELSPLIQATGKRAMEFQTAAPLKPFAEAKPAKVAPLSGREQQGLERIPGIFDLAQRKVTGAGLKDSPSMQAARDAFTTSVLPRIENQAAVAGLGRSTALTNATAAAEAEYLAPLIEAELGREERGIGRESELTLQGIQALLSGGGLERGIEQTGFDAEQADLLRRQALAEQALFVPLGSLVPSTIGQGSKTTGKSGIFT